MSCRRDLQAHATALECSRAPWTSPAAYSAVRIPFDEEGHLTPLCEWPEPMAGSAHYIPWLVSNTHCLRRRCLPQIPSATQSSTYTDTAARCPFTCISGSGVQPAVEAIRAQVAPLTSTVVPSSLLSD